MINLDLVKEMIEEGKTQQELAEANNVSRGTIIKFLTKNKLKTKYVKFKFTKDELSKVVPGCLTYVEVARRITGKQKISGSTSRNVSKAIKDFGIDVSHFNAKDLSIVKCQYDIRNAGNTLLHNPNQKRRTKREHLLRALLEVGEEYKCKECSLGDNYNGKELKLEIDHIDGDWTNNKHNNLRFLCPNCHSQTNTYGNKKR